MLKHCRTKLCSRPPQNQRFLIWYTCLLTFLIRQPLKSGVLFHKIFLGEHRTSGASFFCAICLYCWWKVRKIYLKCRAKSSRLDSLYSWIFLFYQELLCLPYLHLINIRPASRPILGNEGLEPRRSNDCPAEESWTGSFALVIWNVQEYFDSQVERRPPAEMPKSSSSPPPTSVQGSRGSDRDGESGPSPSEAVSTSPGTSR